jgi:hypothetical protein
MTTESRPISYYVAPFMLLLVFGLVAANAYAQPQRGLAWLLCAALFVVMTWVWLRAKRTGSQSRNLVDGTVVYSGLMVVIPLAGKLATVLGTGDWSDLSMRASMAITGLYLAASGNSLPKLLPRWSNAPEAYAAAQAKRRFAGWAWTLAGLVLAIAWLVLPRNGAYAVTFIVLPVTMLMFAVQCFRPRTAQ